ncbi:MAG: hypothetical protein AAF583_02055 [Pseudomonadota bacterium]
MTSISKGTARKVQGGKKPPWARLLIATLLGYISTALISAALTSLLPLHRSEATWLSLLISGFIYVGIFLRVFALKSWLRGLGEVALIGLLGAGILLVTKGVIA